MTAAALSIAQHLSGVPDAWYDAGLPRPALAFWASVCPAGSGCWTDWQEGNLQCVMLVTGTYALAGSPLPVSGNAVDFWSLYQNRPGWVEIPSSAALPAQRGLPAPGDIIVWWDAPPAVGHVAIVLAVQPPLGSHNGAITFAQANGPRPIDTMTLLPDLSVATWPGYAVLGYIRPTSHTPTSLSLVGGRQQGAIVNGLGSHLFTQTNVLFHTSAQKGTTNGTQL